MASQVNTSSSRDEVPAGGNEYLSLLWHQRWFIIVFVGSAIITSLVLTYVYSEKYEAYADISYRAQEIAQFNRAQQTSSLGSPTPQAPFKVISQTLQEVLKSDAILIGTVKALRLDQKTADYEGPWYVVWYREAKDAIKEYGGYAWQLLKYGRIVEEDPVASAVEELRQNIKVRNRDSYVFQLQVRDKDPARAAQITDHLAQVLASWLLEFDRQPGRDRIDQLDAIMADKELRMQQVRSEIQELLSKNRLASVSAESETLTEEISQLNLDRSRLDGDIERHRSRLALINTKLAEKGRAVKSMETELGGRTEYIQPDDFRKLSSERVFEEVELKSLTAKRDSLSQAIAGATARLTHLPAVDSRLGALRLELGSLEREYAMVGEAHQEAKVTATSGVGEVRVLHAAAVPIAPVTPIKFYHVALAGGLGLLCAAGLTYLLAFLNIRVLFPSMGVRGRRQAGTELPTTEPADYIEEKSQNG
jgi:uncharacterized protein involved in exopolysaccharide biosynthesis